MLDVFSSTILIGSGIAQGSGLSPLMLIIYMNDIVTCSNEINFLIYADDTTPYVSGVNIGQCMSFMNKCLSHVYNWLYMNTSSLNVLKQTKLYSIERSNSI